MHGAASYEEAMERLLELYPDLDMDALADIAERTILAATMHGMSTVSNNGS